MLREAREQWTGSAALLASAIIWGVVWYPYRLLRDASLPGELTTLLTYLAALLIALFAARRRLPATREGAGLLLAIALAAGITNLGYVLATLDGPVMMVLLLFYLAPIWTFLFARWLLGERLTAHGAMIAGTALCGAAIMLYRPNMLDVGLAAPEWMALCAGIGFALGNVLLRKARALPLSARSLAIFSGVAGVALLDALWRDVVPHGWPHWEPWIWCMLAALGAVLYYANVLLQVGLARIPANQAIVLLLFELVVGAIASYFLAGETLRWQDWLGGSLIVMAGCVASQKATSVVLPGKSQP